VWSRSDHELVTARPPQTYAGTQPGSSSSPAIDCVSDKSTAQCFILGIASDQAEPWDDFPFHDRDFTGVAELLLVPGCPPGLFTKQFAEFAPSRSNSGLFARGNDDGTSVHGDGAQQQKPQAVRARDPQLDAGQAIIGGLGGGRRPNARRRGSSARSHRA
jgi:hypothetical protein